MPFFKSKSKARRSESAPKSADAARRAENARRGLALTATVVVFSTLALAYLVGVPRLQRTLGDRLVGGPLRVVFDWPPAPAKPGTTVNDTWLPLEIRDELLAVAHQELERAPDLFTASGLKGVGEALLKTGWFDRIDAIRRENGGIVHIVGVWRAPAAVVRHGNIDYLVASAAQILPLAYPRDASGRVVIVGGQMPPAKAGGRVVQGGTWPGADVKAGLDLLTFISAKPWRNQIAAVDVSEYLSLRRLTLVTKWNGRVIWGGSPSDALPGEVPAKAKLVRMDILAKEFGQVDAKRRAVELAGPILLVDDTATANAR